MIEEKVNVTKRQADVLKLVTEGLSVRQMCEKLDVCRHTILSHIDALQIKGIIRRRVNKCPYEVTEYGKNFID